MADKLIFEEKKSNDEPIFLLLIASAAWGIAPLDSLWVESVEDGSITLGFPSVKEADGYRIYRMVASRDSLVWVSWATITGSNQDTIHVRIATVDNDSAFMGVAAYVIEDGKEVLSDRKVVFVEGSGDTGRAVLTAIRSVTWGQVKAGR